MTTSEPEVGTAPTTAAPAPDHVATYVPTKGYPNLVTAVCSCGESAFGASMPTSAELGQKRHAANPGGGHYRDRETTKLLFRLDD